MIRSWLAAGMFAVLLIAGCGKYASPRPPEDFSPAEVKELQVLPGLEGITFTWEAPDQDLRGKELKSIDGYRIYRKEIVKDSEILDTDVEYELLATVTDTHLEELERLREAAREAGKPTRRIKVDDTLIKFQFTDITVQAGKQYVYQLIPVNQGDVEGSYTKLVRVLFRGEASEITIIPYSAFGEQAF